MVPYTHGRFKGFYGKENAKLLFDMEQPSPVGGTSAVEISRRRSKSSAQDLAQAGLLFPEDEEERIQCFELALEEILKASSEPRRSLALLTLHTTFRLEVFESVRLVLCTGP